MPSSRDRRCGNGEAAGQPWRARDGGDPPPRSDKKSVPPPRQLPPRPRAGAGDPPALAADDEANRVQHHSSLFMEQNCPPWYAGRGACRPTLILHPCETKGLNCPVKAAVWLASVDPVIWDCVWLSRIQANYVYVSIHIQCIHVLAY